MTDEERSSTDEQGRALIVRRVSPSLVQGSKPGRDGPANREPSVAETIAGTVLLGLIYLLGTPFALITLLFGIAKIAFVIWLVWLIGLPSYC